MENKQRLEKLDKQKRKLDDELRELNVDIEENTQNEEYMNASDEDKKGNYPELYAMYQKREELEVEYDALMKEIEPLEELIEKEEHEEYINEGKQRYNELNEKIAEKEKEIDSKSKEVSVALEEIQALNKQIYELKATEEYKNGDEATLDKVKGLESEMEFKILDKNKIVTSLKDIRTEINNLEQEKVKLVEEYGEEILPVEGQPVVEQPEASVAEQPSNEQQSEEQQDKPQQAEKLVEEKKTKAKGKAPSVASGIVTAPVAEEQPKEEKKDPKVEFDELCVKAKNEKLDDKEFNKLVEILKDAKKYDEFGITTGIIFNKSRGIFKALENNVGSLGKLSKQVKEVFAKELVGDLQGKELLAKIAKLEKEGLTEDQQALLDKVKTTLNKKESLEQARYVRDTIALEKNEKRWSWLIDFSEDKKRLNAAKEEPSKPKSSRDIDNISNLVKSAKEQNKSYGETEKPSKVVEPKEHD